MTVCFFGNYIADYPRIMVLRKGLEQNGIKVIECNTRETGLKKYWNLFFQHQRLKNEYDYLLVGMAGYTLVWFAKFISRRPVIFDAFVSLYVTDVEDRKLVKKKSLRAKYLLFLEKFSCWLADKVLLDTQAQIDYFIDRHNFSPEIFFRIPVGSNNEFFYPIIKQARIKNKFIVHWHGHIVPFHGLEIVVKAAKILENYPDIEFRIVTRFNSKQKSWQEQVKKEKISSVKFIKEVSYQKLAKLINEAHLVLGVFGKNLKTDIVIPNKIYEGVACRSAIVTGESRAVREYFDNSMIRFCSLENPGELAKAIIDLYNNRALRNDLATNAFRKYIEELTPQKIGERLLQNVLL